MLDIRAVAYIAPVSEVDFASVELTVRLTNYADEPGLVTGSFRVYNDTTGLLIHTSEIVPFSLAAGASFDAIALTDFDPPAPADDTYFVIFDGNASNALVPDGISLHLGAFYFDVKPVGMGPAPAAHHATHQDGGSDEIDITGLVGTEDFLRVDGANPLTAYLDVLEMAPPGNPAANTARIYAEDSKGFTLLSFRDATGMVRKLVRDSVIIVRNNSGAPIPAMQPVYATGSSGNVPTIAPARANAIGTMPAIGVTLEAIADASFGRVMQVGLMENVNTNAFTEGDPLFVDAAVAGAITATPPTYPNIRQEIGTVLVKGIGNGALQLIARSMLYESIIDHAGLLNLAVGDPHTQYHRRGELFDEYDFDSFQMSYYSQWNTYNLLAAAGTPIAGTPNHPGIHRFVCNATPNSGGGCWRMPNNAYPYLIAGLESSDIIIRPQTLAGTTIRAGFLDTTTFADATDGCYFEITTVGGVPGTLVGKCASNSVRSSTATSTVLVTNTWYRLRIEINSDASLVTFTLLSEAGAVVWSDTVNANIPTAAGRETTHGIVSTNSAGVATNIMDIDYINLRIARTLTR
jgi:hypothetical protein